MKSQRSLNKQIVEEAAHWVVTLDAGPLDRGQRKALLRWLKTSPVHLDEFLMALSFFEGVGLTETARMSEISELLRAASASVVPISTPGLSTKQSVSARPAPVRRPWAYAAIAASVAAVFVASVLFVAPEGQEHPSSDDMVVATTLGEQRSLTLDDGSVVYVNTQSRISVHYTEAFRTVEVESGEALFEVEHDTTRPFRVIAGETVAEALGTRFNVRFIDDQAEVSVIEGTVAFERLGIPFDELTREPAAGGTGAAAGVGRIKDGRVILVAGERAGLSAASLTPEVAAESPQTASAWISRRLVFSDDRLDMIASEFNRYNRKKLVIADAALAAERVSGVFASDDPGSLVDFLELTNNVVVTKSGTEILITRRDEE